MPTLKLKIDLDNISKSNSSNTLGNVSMSDDYDNHSYVI